MLKLTFQGEKYFVLKKIKEAPAVLRKPPRPLPKSRPVSGPPVFRNVKTLEEVPGRNIAIGDNIPELAPAEKENRPNNVTGKGFVKTTSVDSGLEADVG